MPAALRGVSSSFGWGLDRHAARLRLRETDAGDEGADLVRIDVARDHDGARGVGKRAFYTGRDDDVDGAEDLLGARRRRTGIAHDVTCLSAPVRNLAHRLAQGTLHGAAHDHLGALGRQRERDRPADRASAVIHHRHLTVQAFHDSFAPRAWYTVRVTRKQRVTRLVYGVFVVGVGAFILSNVWQVARVTFGEPTGANFPKVEGACAAAIEKEIAAIDHARVTASGERDGDAARHAYAAARKAEATDVKAACANDPNGVDALAAVGRLDRSAESHAVRDASEIGPMRQSARSFIRVPQ